MSRAVHPGPLSPEFAIELCDEPARVVLVVRGELDIHTTGHVQRAVDELVLDGARAIVLDLRPVTFIDSGGLRLLLRLSSAAASGDFGFAICEQAGPVRELLELTRLTGRFERATQ